MRFLAPIRVCRSSKDVALYVLWANLEDVEPLFTCISSTVISIITSVIVLQPTTTLTAILPSSIKFPLPSIQSTYSTYY